MDTITGNDAINAAEVRNVRESTAKASARWEVASGMSPPSVIAGNADSTQLKPAPTGTVP